MFLQPKQIRYGKLRKGKLKGLESRETLLRFGEIGLKTKTAGLVTARQLEAARQLISKKLERRGKLWITIFPNLPVTRKPVESRMGKGKGAISHWAARVKSGTILFELCGIPSNIAFEALKSGSRKLPIQTQIFN